ncbi:neprilysin-2-like [Venturia canescens]|uniref:neprilysin-2-like n=1 Tax=Venturia canescens TaxID=32260 RepID=UPI001C9D427A|nr:neprilysin-2-like [Venturia canescens]XP_043274067.1 neprilysin-2-like [Venturia canescens]
MMGVKFFEIVILFTVIVDVILASTYPKKNENENESDAIDGYLFHRAPLVKPFFKVKKIKIKKLGNLSKIKALECQRLRNEKMPTFNKPEESKNECNSKSCRNAAFRILTNMDPNVDPCDHFYRFSCGGFPKRMVIPGSETSVNMLGDLDEELKARKKEIIEAESKPGEPKSLRLVKTLYKSCMNEAAIEAEGLGPLYATLNKLGGWPVLNGGSWNDRDFNWTNSVYKFQDSGYPVGYFINFRIHVDFKNTTKRVVYLDQADLGLCRELLSKGFENKVVDAYYRYMVDVAVILGAPRDRAKKELKESLGFEMKLANISLSKEKRRNTTQLYNPMTLAELTTKYRSIPWKEYFSRLLPSSVTIEEDDVVIVVAPSYISAFEKLIIETPKRVQANYVMWRAVKGTVKYLNEVLRKRQMAYYTEISGRPESEPRWKECLGILDSSVLSKSVNAMYGRQYFTEDATKSAVEMITDVREQLAKILKTVDWMDEKTRRNALEKAASMSSYVAYPDDLNDERLEKFYKNLELSEGNYFENLQNLNIYRRKYVCSKLREPVNQTDEFSLASPANAFYGASANSIQTLAGILHDNFFNSDLPKYMNYGAIGSIIGYEMTLGFDDKNGNLVDRWEPSTEEKFFNRALLCTADRYANYTNEEINLKLNSIIKGENIVDKGVFKEAYLAYNSWAKRKGPEAKLPGIDRTPQQMFWISAANVWCSASKPEAFRVLDSLSNMSEFAKDFNCPLDSKINPEKKCPDW